MNEAIVIGAVMLTIAGLVGSIAPIIPGTPFNYVALLLLNYGAGGGVFSKTVFVVFGILTALSMLLDYAIPLLGLKKFGASKTAMAVSVFGMLVGLVMFSLPGMIVGMFLGAVAGELIVGKRADAALMSGVVTFISSFAALLMKFGLSVVMAGYFFVELVRLIMTQYGG